MHDLQPIDKPGFFATLASLGLSRAHGSVGHEMDFAREQLPNPPLVEALFELRASCEKPYILVPGALMSRLPDFPTLEEADSAVFGPVEFTTTAFHRFRSEDGTRLVQVGPGLFTVNVLGDYGEFSVFRALIERGLRAFSDAAQPTKALRVGIRYINLVRQELLDGLTDAIRVSWSFPHDMFPPERTVSIRGSFEFPEQGGTLGFAISRPHALADGRHGCLLDYDFFKTNPTFELDDCLSWIETGHDLIYQAFRSSLSPALHDRLKEDAPNAT